MGTVMQAKASPVTTRRLEEKMARRDGSRAGLTAEALGVQVQVQGVQVLVQGVQVHVLGVQV